MKTKTFYEQFLAFELSDGDYNGLAHNENTRTRFQNTIDRVVEETQDFTPLLKHMCLKLNTQKDNDYWTQENIRTACQWLQTQKERHPELLWDVMYDNLHSDFTDQLALLGIYERGIIDTDPFNPSLILKVLDQLSTSKSFIENITGVMGDTVFGALPTKHQDYYDWRQPDKLKNLQSALLSYIDTIKLSDKTTNYIFDNRDPTHNLYNTGSIGLLIDFIGLLDSKSLSNMSIKQRSIVVQGYLCAKDMLDAPVISNYGFAVQIPLLDHFKKKHNLDSPLDTISYMQKVLGFEADNIQEQLTGKPATFKDIYSFLSANLENELDSAPLGFDL